MDLFDFGVAKTSNGIPVYFKRLPWARGWLHVRALLRAGAIHDPPKKSGLMHLLEHQLLEDTKRLPDGCTMQEADDDIFTDTLNGDTCLYGTYVEGSCRTRDLAQALAIIEDALVRPVIRAKTLAREKRVIAEEQYDSEEEEELNDLLRRIYHHDLYGDLALGNQFSIAGTAQSLKRITRRDLLRHHRAFFRAENFTFVFVGDITEREAHSAGELLGRRLPRGAGIAAAPPATVWRAPLVPRRTFSMRKVFGKVAAGPPHTKIMVARLIQPPENPAVLHIAQYMLEYMLMHTLRRESGSCYNLNVTNLAHPDHRLFKVYVSIPAKLRKLACRTIESVLELLRTSEAKPLFVGAKQRHLRRLAIQDESGEDIADAAVEDLMTYGRIVSYREVKRQREAVTFSDVLQFFGEQLAPEKLYWFIVKP